ncbi:MAG: DNA starvation/stationary phase protection protein [Verrucomicrobiota bacterium]
MSSEITTSSPVNEAAVGEIAANLNQVVADCYALMASTHLAHWNVEGTDFFQLHEAFQGQYEDLFSAIDDLAERVRALDEYAVGGIKTLSGMTKMDDMSAGSLPGKDMVAALIEGHEVVMGGLFKTRKLAAENGDAETEDVCIGRIEAHEKAVWMLKSYLK